MRRRWIVAAVGGVVVALALGVSLQRASAHCDTMDGPVVSAARQALSSGNINYVLPWVAEKDEPEIKATFEHARQVRALGPKAEALADRFFFETLVRVHRAGEGAPYAGLKPAGAEVNPAVAAADKAFETGSSEALTELLSKAVEAGVASRFAEAKAAQSKNVDEVGARRRGVHGYVEFVHYVEGIYDAAEGTGEAEAAHTPAEH